MRCLLGSVCVHMQNRADENPATVSEWRTAAVPTIRCHTGTMPDITPFGEYLYAGTQTVPSKARLGSIRVTSYS